MMCLSVSPPFNNHLIVSIKGVPLVSTSSRRRPLYCFSRMERLGRSVASTFQVRQQEEWQIPRESYVMMIALREEGSISIKTKSNQPHTYSLLSRRLTVE